MTVTVNFTLQGAGVRSEPMVRLAAMSSPSGGPTVWEISPDRASRQPSWDPTAALPPLSIADAAATASTWLKERNQDGGPFELQNVMLTRRRGQGRVGEFWFYQLDFVVGSRLPGPPFRVVVLLDGSVVEPGTDALGRNAAAQPAANPLPAGVYRPGPGISIPRVLNQVQPNYTEQARRARIQGTVQLEFVVQPDGSVGNPRVVRSLEPSLDQEAIDAMRQWRFAPGTKDGRPVPVMMTVEMSFTLR
jgi:TonB family protein